MTKKLIIKLHNGREIVRDITLEKFPNIPFGAPANHEGFGQLCHFMATTGVTDTDNTHEKQLTFIAPAAIESVTVKFSND